MSVQIQVRRDTSANWGSANPVLSIGEIGFETDTGNFKFGDGSTAWSSITKVYRYGATGIDGQLTLQGSSGQLWLSANSDGGEYNIGVDTTGTLAFYGAAGEVLNLALLDGDLTLAHDPTSALHAATKQYVDAASSPTVLSACALFQPNANMSYGSYSQGSAVVQRFVVPATTVVDHSRFFWFGGSTGVVANIALYDGAGALLDNSTHTGSSADTLEMAFGGDVTLDAGAPYFALFVLSTASGAQTVQSQSQPSSHDAFAYNVTGVTSIPGTLPGATNTGGDMPLIELFHS